MEVVSSPTHNVIVDQRNIQGWEVGRVEGWQVGRVDGREVWRVEGRKVGGLHVVW